MSKFEPSIVACALMGVGCVASTEITRVMKEAKLDHYTAPFVASTWATWAIGLASGLKTSQIATSLLPNIASEPSTSLYPVVQALSNTFKGLGQVFLQESAVVGIIFAAGLLVSSRKAAVAGLAGAGVAAYVAALTGFSSVSIGQGLLGYNAALCAIALTGDEATDGGKPFDKKKVIYAAIASLATLPLYAGFEFMGVPALTAPFVLSTWLVSSLMPKKEPASPN
jgi:urea transporter